MLIKFDELFSGNEVHQKVRPDESFRPLTRAWDQTAAKYPFTIVIAGIAELEELVFYS